MTSNTNSNSTGHLLTLLRLRGGLLSDGMARSLQRKIGGSDSLANHWHLVNENWDSSSGLSEFGEDEIDAELVAAFVEGNLDDDDALALERRIWNSHPLLCEVTATFRFLYTPQLGTQTVGNNRPLTKRILDQVTDKLENPEPLSEQPPQQLTGLNDVRNNGRSSGRSNGRSSGGVPTDSEKKVRTVSTTWLLLVTFATAAVLLIVASLVVLLVNGQGRSPIAVPDGVDQASPDRKLVESPENPSDVVDPRNVDGLDRENNREIGPSTIVENNDGKTSEDPQANNLELATDDSGELDLFPDPFAPNPENQLPKISDDAMANNRANNPAGPKVLETVIKPVWTDVKGLIGIRDARSENFVGYNFASELTKEMSVVALPGSWAEGSIADLGQVILDGDGEIRLTQIQEFHPDGGTLDSQKTFGVQLLAGRVGLTDLPNDSKLKLRFGNNSWPLTVVAKNTSFAIDAYSGTPTLAVRNGKINIDGRAVRRGQTISWQRGEFSSPKKNQKNLRWMDRPDSFIKISDELQKRLMSSHQLKVDIEQLRGHRELEIQTASKVWSLSLNPALAVRVFSTRNTDQWNLTFDWLLQQHRRGPSRRGMWAALGESTGDREFVRSIFAWSRKIAVKQMPDRNEAEKMIRRLSDEKLFIRFAAARLLESCFANPTDYSPELAPQLRTRHARAWRTHILSMVSERHRRDKKR